MFRQSFGTYQSEAPAYVKRLTFCTVVFYSVLMATLVLSLNDGCRFVNKINFLLWKCDALSNPKSSKHTAMKLLFATFLGLEFLTIVALYITLKQADTPWTNQLIGGCSFVARGLAVFQEQLSSIICLELKTRFSNLNDRILGWEPKASAFLNKAVFLRNESFSRITYAAAEFSNLSLALKELNSHFGIFWLLNVAQLNLILTAVLASLTTLPLTSNLGITMLVMSAISAIRLMTMCTLSGDTTTQVNVNLIKLVKYNRKVH